jgi:glycosyltransferase involved in cell wall biosynthesis
MISTPFVSVPPTGYGGTELIVSELVNGLVARGHHVTLFATGDSRAACEVRWRFARPRWPPDPYPELDHVAWAVESVIGDHARYDVVHSHAAAALAFSALVESPMVYTVHHQRETRLLPLYTRSPAHFIAISERQRELAPELNGAEVIHHGLSVDRYPLGPGGGPALFLGRLAREKGVHAAIDAAAAAEVPLVIAGRPHPPDLAYHQAEVVPRLQLSGVAAIGVVGGARKLELLGRASALLFPIDWDEPFGLVMIEAMLSGTPVLAFPRGAVPEVVEEGITGFLCDDVEQMADRLRLLARGSFDRARCRARARARFSAVRMVEEHLALYRRVVTAATGRAALGACDDARSVKQPH